MEIKDLRQRENDSDLPTRVWWEVPPLLKIHFPGFLNLDRDFSDFKYQVDIINWSTDFCRFENLLCQQEQELRTEIYEFPFV